MTRWIVAWFTAAAMAGCAGAPNPVAPSQVATTHTRAATSCMAEAPTVPTSAKALTVTRVVDGDTFETSDGGKHRVLGVNTPESVDPRRPVQKFGKEASAYTKVRLEGKTVQILPGRTPKDRYGRHLSWLWLDGVFFNAQIVADGMAQVYTFSDNPDYADMLLACQRESREAVRGLWLVPEYRNGDQASKMDRK